VEGTVAGLTVASEKNARCFFAKADQDQILDPTSLGKLFRDLISGNPECIEIFSDQLLLTKRNRAGRHDHTPDHENLIDDCVRATGARKALLSLFLYQDREQLLSLFLRWTLHDVTGTPADRFKVPSDACMPFTEASLRDHGVEMRFSWEILRTQAIFKPVVIWKNQHLEFKETDRLPFIGTQAGSKAGSSGTVSETMIARMHWKSRVGDHVITGNPKNNQVVALKTFEKIPIVRDMEKTTEEFNIELGILKDLRKHNTKHDMIMLDWGSITILDETGTALRHSLIFELATFSLQDFLESERRAQTYRKQSQLLARLVDLVEALAVLHKSLKTLHLDIKPDNILVFESGSSRSDNQNRDTDQLVFKLSDFGLARKIGTRQRTGHNQINSSYQPSRSSATSATRPAGAYQGPEIQQQDSSRAGRGSDVWSIGCVSLMMLAFVTGGPNEVLNLKNSLTVNFLARDGRQNLFYIRSDTHPWKNGDVNHYQYEYMKQFTPVIGQIRGTQPQLQAAVNPRVIDWSNILYGIYEGDVQQRLIQQWLEAIFCTALLIDHTQRPKAAELHQALQDIQIRWHKYEEDPENFPNHQIVISPSDEISDGHQWNSSSGRMAKGITQASQARGELRNQRSHASSVPMIAVSASPTPPASPLPVQAISDNTSIDRSNSVSMSQLGAPLLPVASSPPLSTLSGHVDSFKPQAARLRPGVPNTPPAQICNAPSQILSTCSLCSVIEANDADAVRRELGDGNARLREPCPGTDTYPIHCALKYRAYNALAVLLEKSDPDIMDLECGGRTALEMACEDGGRPEAFRCFMRYHTCLHFPEDVYKDFKKELGNDARKAFVELYDVVNLGKKKKKSWPFGGRK
jgi:serine/threonine protein kinase